MRNIVFIIPSFRKCGPINVVFDIIHEMDRTLFNIKVIALKPERTNQNICDDFKKIGVQITQFNYSEIQLLLCPRLVARNISKDLKGLDNVIIHAHCLRPNIVATFIKNTKLITTTHNISEEDYISVAGKIFGTIMYKQFNRSLKYYDRVVVLSDYMQLYYTKYSKSILKIPNGVTVPRFSFSSRKSLRNQLGLPTDKKIFVVSGYISERKNVEYIIKELKKFSYDFLCLIIGNGDRVGECIKLVNNDPRFLFTGFKTNVAEYLFVSDLYISASKSEGLPLSVLEALNIGLPCALSAIPPHLEIISNIKVDGVQSFSLNEGGLFSCINQMYNNDYSFEVISNKANAIYSAKSMANKYSQLYMSI